MLAEDTMRSEIVFSATARVSNRYLLAKLASKVTRKFHKPNTRIQDTMNDSFARLSRGHLIADTPSENDLQSLCRATEMDVNSACACLKSAAA
jgi:hypothetical protein